MMKWFVSTFRAKVDFNRAGHDTDLRGSGCDFRRYAYKVGLVTDSPNDRKFIFSPTDASGHWHPDIVLLILLLLCARDSNAATAYACICSSTSHGFIGSQLDFRSIPFDIESILTRAARNPFSPREGLSRIPSSYTGAASDSAYNTIQYNTNVRRTRVRELCKAREKSCHGRVDISNRVCYVGTRISWYFFRWIIVAFEKRLCCKWLSGNTIFSRVSISVERTVFQRWKTPRKPSSLLTSTIQPTRNKRIFIIQQPLYKNVNFIITIIKNTIKNSQTLYDKSSFVKIKY